MWTCSDMSLQSVSVQEKVAVGPCLGLGLVLFGAPGFPLPRFPLRPVRSALVRRRGGVAADSAPGRS